MVREARFSWDDLDPLDPTLRHERPDDFDGPDDDWVNDLKRTQRRARKRRRRSAKSAPTERRDLTPPAPPTDPRRHLAGADWLEHTDEAA